MSLVQVETEYEIFEISPNFRLIFRSIPFKEISVTICQANQKFANPVKKSRKQIFFNNRNIEENYAIRNRISANFPTAR